MWVYIVISIFVLLIICVLVLYNGMVKARNRVDEAFSTMDVYLKKRWDLVPNIVAAVTGYTQHESTLLKEITTLRSTSYHSLNTAAKASADMQLSQQMGRLMAIAEAYPDLKSSENFRDLSKQLADIEADIANARKYYNATVRIINDKVETFPGNLIAGLFGFKTMNMFEANEMERESVKIKF